VERTLKTIRDKIQKYLTHYNTLRFIHDLPKFVAAYNNSVHTSTGMAPERVGDKDALKIFLRAKHRQQGIPSAKPKFIVGQNVRISKLKAKFEKSSAQNFSTEIIKIIKVIRRIPRPVYELEDLNRTPIDGQFYQEELVPVRISRRTVYKIDKILSRRVRKGIREVLVHWRGYPASFDLWIPESNVKKN
jgi:transcriptional regulator with PAS, ATPase and Fis domain